MALLVDRFGVTLDAWQQDILRAAMGERADGTWAAKQVGVSVPRQNGKTLLMVARALAGALLFGEQKIVVSAHAQDTAREAFGTILDLRDKNPALDERIAKVMTAINRESITFKNGAVIQFKARTVSGTRGFSADCLLLDEAQILGVPAWVSINSTMSARENPQIWLLGTPPTPEDNGEVFGSIRQSALEKKTTALAWLEWAAAPDADPASEHTRWSANPAWWTRINHDVVQGEFESYPPDRFRLDRLGIWRDDALSDPPVISKDDLKALAVADAPVDGAASFGVKFSPDGSTVALAAARRLEGDRVHVELLERRSMGSGTSWLVEFLAGGDTPRWREAAQIVIDGKAHAGNLVNDLRAEKVPAQVIVAPSTDQVTTAHSMFLEAVTRGTVSTFDDEGQDTLFESFQMSVRRKIGNLGGWGLEPKPGGESTSAEAVIFAHWAARVSKRKPGRKQRAVVMR